MALLYKADMQRGREWRRLFQAQAADIEVRLWPDIGDPAQVRYLAAWEAPHALDILLPNLQVLFATSAGIDHMALDRLPEALQVVRMLDPGITRGMCEFACHAVLTLHRDMLLYGEQQRSHQWQAHPVRNAAKRRVGIMGLGEQGKQVLAALKPFGFELLGWASSRHEMEGVQCYVGEPERKMFLCQCDILLCLLPLTPATRGILDQNLFASLPQGAALINMGRGAHLVEEDLIPALNSGQLAGAVLDVLQDEPPAPDHPFWDHPRIRLTPHIAAMTQTESAFEVLLANIRRHQRGEPMHGLVDRHRGY